MLRLILFLLFTSLFSPVQAMDRIFGNNAATRSEVIAKNAMAATSQPLATQIALGIMKSGGNAIDAAIAANAALGLMEPTGCGIGGDLFAIVWIEKEKKLYGLNASGPSPKGLNYDQLKNRLSVGKRETIPPYGMLPISVPGTVAGWDALHSRFGQLDWSKLFTPAIDYAETGFPVSELIAYYWQKSVPRLSTQIGDFTKVFAPNGRAPSKGELFRNPALANTYRTIAKDGANSFYSGTIAQAIDVFMRANDGYLRFDDLNTFKAEWVKPKSVNYMGYDVWELPPNGQGYAVLQMLQLLKQFDLKGIQHNSAEYLHLMTEVKKLVFEDRAKFYSDPKFTQQSLDWLLSEDYAKERAKLINRNKAAQLVKAGQAPEHGDTIYLATADKEGNMVSLIQSNYRGMGSGVVVPGLGFVFQNRGELFSMDPEHANAYAPNKRPFHTIIPAFVTKGEKAIFSFGVMGGAMQPQGHVQILVNLFNYQMNLQVAGDIPRWRHINSSQATDSNSSFLSNGGILELESGIDSKVIRDLKNLGHKVRIGKGGFGGYQGILKDNRLGVYFGASESRKDGQAAGY